MAVLISLAVYFMALLFISWYARNAAKSQAFVLGERKIGLLGVAAQAVGSMDGSGLVIFVMFGMTLGFGSAWLILGTAIGFGLLAWQGPRIRSIAQQYSLLNINDLLAKRIGPRTQRLSLLITLATSWLATAGQLYVTGLIFYAATGWPQWIGILLGGGVVMLYTIVGGYLILVRTDIFQWIAATTILSLALIFGHKPSLAQGLQQFLLVGEDWKWGLVLLPIFVYYATPDTWQRIFSARNDNIARLGPALVIPIHSIYLLACIVLGYTISATVGSADPVNGFYRYLSSSAVPPWIAGAMGVLAMAMVMSSLDTRSYVFISLISKTVLGIDPDQKLVEFVKKTRIVTAVYFTVSILVAIFISNIVQYMINTVTVFAILGPILFIAIYADSRIKGLDNTMLGVTLFGVLTFLSMFAMGKLTTVLMTVMPVVATSIVAATAYFVLWWRCKHEAQTLLRSDTSKPNQIIDTQRSSDGVKVVELSACDNRD